MSWADRLPVVQIRVARPTNRLEEVVAFYRDGVGLPLIGSFHNHEGYSGVMLELPGGNHHLEFTSDERGTPGAAPSRDNLLVFYIPVADVIEQVVGRMRECGYEPVPSENPYWDRGGVTFEDPDGWRVVFMHSHGLSAPESNSSEDDN